MTATKLAIEGGAPVRTKAWPARGLIGAEEKAAVNALFDEAIASGEAFGYGGAQETAFCEEFAGMMGGGFADAVSSGTSAVYVALKALNLDPFTEVIVGAITDPGGIMPIPLQNLIPMIADCTPDSYNTGPQEIEEVITPLTRAIVVPHIAGEPADMEGIMALARKHNLLVVEDCAQAHHAFLHGKRLGAFGHVAAFSTMFGKHFCTGGQGGVVFTRDEALYQRVRWASDRGKPFGLTGATNQVAALNMNLNDLDAAIGRVQLRKLPEIVARRRAVVAKLNEALRDVRAVSVPELLPGAEGSYWFLRLRFHPEAVTCDKAAFLAAVAAEGRPPINPNYAANVAIRAHWFVNRRVFGNSGYPWASPDYTGERNRRFTCPNTLTSGEAHFTLGINEAWTDEEVADVAAIFARVEAAYRA